MRCPRGRGARRGRRRRFPARRCGTGGTRSGYSARAPPARRARQGKACQCFWMPGLFPGLVPRKHPSKGSPSPASPPFPSAGHNTHRTAARQQYSLRRVQRPHGRPDRPGNNRTRPRPVVIKQNAKISKKKPPPAPAPPLWLAQPAPASGGGHCLSHNISGAPFPPTHSHPTRGVWPSRDLAKRW